jgi:hypothetical protein
MILHNLCRIIQFAALKCLFKRVSLFRRHDGLLCVKKRGKKAVDYFTIRERIR